MTLSLAHSSLRVELARAAPVTAAAVLVFVGSWLLLHEGFYRHGQIVDTPTYQRYGELMVDGRVPYHSFGVEYPPGALVPFVLPSLGAKHRTESDYRRRFEVLMVLCGCIAIVSMAVILVSLGCGTRTLVAALGFAALAPLALGPVIQTRFDLLPAALTVAALAALVCDRPRIGLALLGAGAAVKVFPAVLVPLALAHVWHHRGRRVALLSGAAFAAVVGVAVLPFAIGAAHGLGHTISTQFNRPLQIESLGAASLLAAHRIAGVGVHMDYTYGSQNLRGTTADALALTQSILQVAAAAAIWIWFALRPRSSRELIAASAGALAAFVALGKILSPQFLVWLIPLVPLVRGRRGLLASAVLAVALILTQLWFPQRYFQYSVAFEPWLVAVVVARDLLLIVLAAALLPARGSRQTSTGMRSASQDVARPSTPQSTTSASILTSPLAG
jgi:hypothetical protein